MSKSAKNTETTPLKIVKKSKDQPSEHNSNEGKKPKDKLDQEPVDKKQLEASDIQEKPQKVGGARGVESMFRNSYRAQLDMIALAATKANIMISLNGVLVSMLLLSGAYFVSAEPLILVPVASLLLTCTVAITFAVLAARPDVDSRNQSLDDFVNGEADMLIFQQFSKLSSEEFNTAMWEMLKDHEKIYRNMIAHIYDLGRIADKKFARLHISYNSFMIGLIFSVILSLAVLSYHLLIKNSVSL